MKLMSLHKIFFICCFSLFFFLEKSLAQPPCTTQPPITSEVVLNSGNQQTVVCNGQPLTLSSTPLSTCPDCTYEWSNGDTGPYTFAYSAGTFSVTVTDNAPGGCIGVSTVLNITTATVAIPTIDGDSFNVCNGTSPAVLEVENVCPTCSYQWYDNNPAPATPITGEITSILTTLNVDEYFVTSTDTASGCSESSRVIVVGSAFASVPPLTSSSSSICDSNTTTLSTIDCNGCTYQWNFYDFNPDEKLIITGVFDGTRPNGKPKGVELYAIGNIPDLSVYGLDVISNGGTSSGGATFNFSSIGIGAGTFIYVTEDAIEFENFFGFPANYVSSVVNINGNDAIELYYDDGTGDALIDVFGNPVDVASGTDYSAGWAYRNGWASRRANYIQNTTFVPGDWYYGKDSFHTDRDNNFWKLDSMPNSSFSTVAIPSTKLMISGVFSDTSGGTKGRGIELYAVGNISDLSIYGVGVSVDGTGQTGSPSFTFPPVSIVAGTYLYLTDNSSNFSAFFGTTPPYFYIDPTAGLMDGNDAVELFQNGNVVDVFGDTSYTGAILWDYQVGWAKSRNNRVTSSSFSLGDWDIHGGDWTGCLTNGACSSSKRYNIGTGTYPTFASSLIISGIFDGNRPGSAPKGIEFYTMETIPDLSNYSVSLDSAGGGSYSIHNFPSVFVPANRYIYLTNNGVEFDNMYGIVTPSPQIATDLDFLDGNDAVQLFLGGNLVDLFGNTSVPLSNDYSMNWAYQDGWAYRYPGAIPNRGVFNEVNWNTNNHAYRTRNNSFDSIARMPIQTYSSAWAGTVLNVIPNADTSFYTTNVVGDYIVEVAYPNSCLMLSDTMSIDTFIFSPQILASMPSSGNVSSDTSYLCSGSSVVLYMEVPYSAPPTWVYQWSRNGVNLSGQTGFNYTATSPGLYKVKVVDQNGCTSFSNTIVVLNSTNAANPGVSANTVYLCTSTATATLTTPTCSGCTYAWKTEEGGTPSTGTTNLNYYTASNAGGFFVEVTDVASGCTYNSSIVLISDTIYPSPNLTTGSSTVCSPSPLNLSTTPCAGCDYIWKLDTGGAFISIDTTQQFTYQINSAGKYRVEILYPNGCQTTFSNTIQATFQTVNAAISTPPLTSICNGETVTISAIPDTIACPDCSFTFYRDGVAMQLTEPRDQQELSLDGNYTVVVRNAENCSDTSTAVTFTEVSLATSIRQSTGLICGPTSCVTLEIDSCDGCAYQWFYEGNAVSGAQDTFYNACGFAAEGTYVVEVSKLGCLVVDSVEVEKVDSVLTIDIKLDSSTFTPASIASPTICDGNSVFLVDRCDVCIDSNYYQYQWFTVNDTIGGASFESFQVDTPGTYFVQVVDINNCIATSNQITVQEFTPPSNFALDFSPLGPAVPITYGTINMDTFLTPSSLHPVGAYTSLTANNAIAGDVLDIGAAGSGFHIITYTYIDSNSVGACTFSTFDTIEVLGAMAMDIDNKEPIAPAFEACLLDTLIITVTNFTFIPEYVVFVKGGGDTIQVPVMPVLTQFAGVWSGDFEVEVPDGARTGKLKLEDSVSTFESDNFFVIKNPAVTIDLLGTVQPICSNLDTAEFSGLPTGGTFSTHYIGFPDNPNLMTDSLLLLDSITGYDSMGIQNVMMMYTYTPTYTGGVGTCPEVQDSLFVEIRDAELYSVAYTPIALTQNSEPLANLTLVTDPVSALKYNNSYTGTYVIANTLLPSSIDTTGGYVGYEYIDYQINNAGCINTSTDSIDIWPGPALLDSIPTYLCSQDDTVFIRRNATDIQVTYRGAVIYTSTLYKYSSANGVTVGNPTEMSYNEKVNIMEITSSNGGLNIVAPLAPNEIYHFVPANVTGNATNINIKFKYWRESTFFDGSVVTEIDTTEYIIAEVSKNFLIEDPSTVAINPIILADTIFCPQNQNHLFLGTPAGGQYYLEGGPIGYQTIPSNIFNPLNYPIDQNYQLTYVYTGQACVDSAKTGIYVPDSFDIQVAPNNGTGDYCATAPNDSVFFQLIGVNTTHPIDTSSAQFFISNVQSGPIFSPTQVGPPGLYPVRYVVSDIYGCPEEATDVFEVFPIPNLSLYTIEPLYCLNADTSQIHLYQTSTNGTQNELTYSGGYTQNETVTLVGPGVANVVPNPNPAEPYFFPALAGVGTHEIAYVYTDSNACIDSINLTVQVLPLPTVYMTTTNGDTLNPFYCENDTVPLFGFPIGNSFNSGYGSDRSVLYGNPIVDSLIPSSLDSFNKVFLPFIDSVQPGLLTEYLYYYYEDNNGCRDTTRYPVTIRNFTTDPVLTGLPASICASDLEILVFADSVDGYSLENIGWFESPFLDAFSTLGTANKTDTTLFYPDSAGVQFATRPIDITYHYTDTSGNCFNSISDTVQILALPHLTLSEAFASNLGEMDFPGSKLIAPATDTFYHICLTEPEIPVYAYNTTGIWDAAGDSVIFPQPSTVQLPDTIGEYVKGEFDGGIQSNNDPVNTAYGYISADAGPGLDTIRYVLQDKRGCIDSVEHYIFVDSLPNLVHAGLGNYDASINRYVYCETDPSPPLILPSPIGVSWSLFLDGTQINSVPFQLDPTAFAQPGVYVDVPLHYYYTGQIYANGGVCADSLQDTIEIRPAPQLAWVNAPSSFCQLDSNTLVPLSATPYGGNYYDITTGLNLVPGIVQDSMFVPNAQAGKRDIVYQYTDTVTGCTDVINHTIYVYAEPRINFDISGGCSGAQVDFVARTAPFGLEYLGPAIDSITMVIWDYGDGQIDTLSNLPDTLVIPDASHVYNGSGVFFPSLTVWNQGMCDTTFVRRIVISPSETPLPTVPYVEDFQVDAGGWIQESADTLSQNGIVSDSLWQWGLAYGANINTAGAGNNVWGTRLSVPGQTTYKQGENAWVYSPCFDLTNLERPMIRMNLWRNAQNHVDGAVLQYHDDVTNEWKVLGKHGKGINWYQAGFVVASPGFQTLTPTGWTNNTVGWETARYRLDNFGNDLRARTNVRFRMAFASSPSTLLGVNDGIAFDSVIIGDRTRNVLVEHFSGTGYPGIEAIEDSLYYSIYNNLYGRDVKLIQYHTNMYSSDLLYNFSPVNVAARVYDYGITDANQVRVDGDTLVARTSDLILQPDLETLDVESLEDPKFKLEFLGFPLIQTQNNVLTATVKVTALQDLPQEEYSVHVVVVEDSLVTTTNHTTMSVMRDMLPDYAGERYNQPWVISQSDSFPVSWPYSSSTHPTPSRLGLVVFVQNVATKEVYQVECSRDLSAFVGDSLFDVSVDNIEDLISYEIVNLKLFPNPAKDLFNVEFEKALEGDYDWQLIDVTGRILDQGMVQRGTEKMQVATERLSPGMYIFTIRDDQMYTQRKVIISNY